MGKITKRPWGSFEVLSEESDHKVKRIIVEPGGCLSLQLHHKRSEHWFIVSGCGILIINEEDKPILAGDSFNIHKKEKHRVENFSKENLIIIEVQTGECDENDIERFEDKYGRV